jgi:hypothetical protein
MWWNIFGISLFAIRPCLKYEVIMKIHKKMKMYIWKFDIYTEIFKKKGKIYMT